MFLATCLALLERKKRDHHAMVVANRRPPVMSGRPHRTHGAPSSGTLCLHRYQLAFAQTMRHVK